MRCSMVNRHIRAAAMLLLGLLNFSAVQAGSVPDSPNAVLEATGPGLSRLDIRFSIQGKELPGAELKGEKDLVVGGVTLPSEGRSDYEITAFDREGRVTHYGKGSVPAPGEEGR